MASDNEKPRHVHHDTPEFEEEVASYEFKLRGRKLTAAIAFISGTGFTLFGFDQGVMSALLTANQFEKVFPQVITGKDQPSNHATLQSFVVAIYEIGCLMGALSNLWLGDKLGRRKTMVIGAIIMTIGAILQTTSFSYAQLVVARIITGVGNGLNWIDFALFWANDSSVQWRFPISFQIFFAFVMAVGVNFLPESPRWLIKVGRKAEALAVISALDDKPINDPGVRQTFKAINEAVELEEGNTPSGKVQLKEIFTGGRGQNFRRVVLGVVVQAFQQLTGINLITYYATILFERLGLSDVKSRILAACNGTEYFFIALLPLVLIDRIGRRKLMLFGAIGQCITMVLLAVLGEVDNSPAQVVSAVLLFVFNSFFALGWLGMTWLYPAEIVGLRMRGPANALSTASNWIFNFLVVMIVGPSFQNINWGTYIVFASLNAMIVPIVYLFFPETAGRSLEDMDVIFAIAYNENVSPVAVSLRKDIPAAGTPEADRILGFSSAVSSREDVRELREHHAPDGKA
ncbi:related to transporter (major facilitator superfamily) [Armillaria ostoyae]|uniref:Related to transporter (Major facilitator superfamily) n=1 Tax=Armillaria ostoyae TaxID=47428 RepID=A0A284R068_ARMOS|nr:related to transporter (major facilitator superfamily) [Armillaria ostoyae]